MQDLTITLAQAHQYWEDKRSNLEHFERILDHQGATDLVLLPEMFHTGFSMNAAALAEEMHASEGLDWLRAQAEKRKAAFYTSFIASENGNYYNRGVFVEPGGAVSVYDKRKCFGLAGEDYVFTPGNTEQIVLYKGWKINLQICYDLRFPEISRNGMDADGNPFYDLMLYVANWPDRRIAHWDALLPARAIENQCFVAAVNRVGEDGAGLSYPGHSGVWSAAGEKILSADPGNEMSVSVSLQFSELDEFRRRLPFLKDR